MTGQYIQLTGQLVGDPDRQQVSADPDQIGDDDFVVAVEIHGQHDDRGLLNPKGHRALLDAFGRLQSRETEAAWNDVVRVEAQLVAEKVDPTGMFEYHNLMPRFPVSRLSDAQVDDVIAYVQYAKHADNRGGWSLGDLGPWPEGMVAWLLAGSVLVALCCVFSRRART